MKHLKHIKGALYQPSIRSKRYSTKLKKEWSEEMQLLYIVAYNEILIMLTKTLDLGGSD